MAKGLGKGLSALFSETEEAYGNAQVGEGGVAELTLGEIYPNPDQPRKAFDEGAMIDLMRSVKEHGVINPIVVNREPDGRYMIIAGERRYRAAMMAGLETVPVIIKEYSEKEIQEISLIENLQREDLNPIEAAYGMKRLMEEYRLTQEVLAERLGKSRPAVANALRLLSLPEAVRAMLMDGSLSAGHARAVLSVEGGEKAQTAFAQLIVKNALSVRQAEQRAKTFVPPSLGQEEEPEKHVDPNRIYIKEVEKEFSSRFGRRVSIHNGAKKGRLELEFYGVDDLNHLLDLLEKLPSAAQAEEVSAE